MNEVLHGNSESFEDGRLTKCVRKIRKHKWAAYVFLFLWWITGTLVFMHVEGYDWVTSMFVVAQIVTTVGYGDITPTSQCSKLFVAFYALVGVLVAAGCIDRVTEIILDAEMEFARNRMRRVEDALVKGLAEADVWLDDKVMARNSAAVAIGTWLACIGVGTLYFAVLDNCICDDGAEACNVPQIGGVCPHGEIRTYIDAFYMCIITLATIGFGDQTPQTTFGRLFGTFWMLFGIAATGNLLGSITSLLRHERMHKKSLTRKMYEKIDKDDRGIIHKWQFMQYMLLKNNLVDEEDINFIMSQFRALDVTQSGVLSLDDLPCDDTEAESKLHQGFFLQQSGRVTEEMP